MPEKFQLHISGLNLLSRCGVAFENRYIKRLPSTTSPSLVIGTAVHRAQAEDLGTKMNTGALLPDSDVADIARDAAREEWALGEVRLDEQDRDDGYAGTRDEAVDASVGMASFYHAAAAPKVTPVAVERGWVLDVEGAAMPIQVAGRIDLQTAEGAIRDTKTSAKSPIKSAAHESIQLTMYSLALLKHDGALPTSVGLDYVVRTPKRHDIKLVQLESTRSMEDLPPLLERVASAAKIIKAGLFTPADPSAWWCSKKFCSYWELCPYAVHPVSVRLPEVVAAQ